ncbi:unnamed protein product [Pieris brassicae]|uniref:Uncharacterized protein n=1 Tax=Pieris brassicae TaxID=7116 RepID=A0A9P0SZI5_PIEBR|nr:unnamed protein product [Pieris brassicae]
MYVNFLLDLGCNKFRYGNTVTRRSRAVAGLVPRRAPHGPAVLVNWPHERAVLAQRARVWYARALAMAPILAALALLALLPGELCPYNDSK